MDMETHMPKIDGNSRDRILDAAFELFSTRGFSETSMRDIAQAVDIKAASLYNHFDGKQELFEALIGRETGYVEEKLRLAGAMASPDDDPGAYSGSHPGQIADLVWRSYSPFFEDARVKMLMRLLAANRYGDERLGGLYRDIFVERPLSIQEAIFGRLVSNGTFDACDTRLAAAQFHGPMLMLMEAEVRPEKAKTFCLDHVRRFNASHRKDD